jgi:hypothetical protein
MTYNPNIPQSTDIFPNSQPQILTNFTQLNTQFTVEHDALTGPADGKHKYVTLQQGIGPAPVGTDAILCQQLSGLGASKLTYRTSTGTFNVPIGVKVLNQGPIPGGGPTNLYDLAATGNFTNLAGTILCWETTHITRQTWSTFVYIGGIVYIGSAQLVSPYTAGTHISFTSTQTNGIIQVNNSGAAVNVSYTITGMAL